MIYEKSEYEKKTNTEKRIHKRKNHLHTCSKYDKTNIEAQEPLTYLSKI